MRERPILFSGPMVRAILAGKKTQTRRIMKHQPQRVVVPGMRPMLAIQQPRRKDRWLWPNVKTEVLASCPYGQPGDRLWVRETWADDAEARWEPQKRGTFYRADDDAEEDKASCDAAGIPFTWCPSIHMHRWRSRITLEITDVRVQRLQDINDADAQAEGVEGYYIEDRWYWRNYLLSDDDAAVSPMLTTAKESVRTLWEFINGADSWAGNLWVWVVEFRRADHA